MSEQFNKKKTWLLVVSVITLGILIAAAFKEDLLANCYVLQHQYAPKKIVRIVNDILSQSASVNSKRGNPTIGRSVFKSLCGNCHGHSGGGGTAGNALNSLTFLAIASDRYLADAIINGRPGTEMAAWEHLSVQAISDILAYIRTWQPVVSSYGAVQTGSTVQNVDKGRELYQDKCAVCHGDDGKGGIGIALNTPDLLRVADNPFLYRAIVEGRPDTAMPAWRHLSSDQIAALIAYIRSWEKRPIVKIKSAPPRGDFVRGEAHYKTTCQSCHGEQGIGGTGPRLVNSVFLDSASDDMLFHWISQGRSGTAMKGFLKVYQGSAGLTPEQIADVIAYLHHLSAQEKHPLLRAGTGDVHAGAALFRSRCALCHGADGQGITGPQLNNPTFLSFASNGFLAATMALGRTGTAMKSIVDRQEGLDPVAPQQINDIIAFMRTWENRTVLQKNN